MAATQARTFRLEIKSQASNPPRTSLVGDVPRHVKALKTNQPAAAQAGKQLAAIFTFMNQPY